MSDAIIQIENLSKKYRLSHQSGGRDGFGYVALRDVLAEKTKSCLRAPLAWIRSSRSSPPATGVIPPERPSEEDFWALKDVSFEVKRGECVGIIGRNGAGKSTLLKILSRITEPTTGRVTLDGRVSSLLEVGTGFHPELTGRENIYLNGAILGMARAEIRKKFDEIVAFAEIEKFLDTPVKRYSSGMYVRLAFAVAAHLEPEILVVDEVLAVGDAQFQRKCLDKMKDVASNQGRALLFVSHNMVAIQSLCSRAILLTQGRITASGPVREVVPKYLLSSAGPGESEKTWEDLSSAPGNELARITAVRVAAAESEGAGLIAMDTPVSLDLEYRRLLPDRIFHITLHLVNDSEVIVLTTSPGVCPPTPGPYRSRCTIPGNLLNSGEYRLKVLLVEDHSRGRWLERAITSFSVVDLRERNVGWMGREPSVIQIPLDWRTIGEIRPVPFGRPTACTGDPGVVPA